MYSFEFEYWSDIFLDHFLVSVLTSILVVITTLFISKKYGMSVKNSEKGTQRDDIPRSEQIPGMWEPALTKSPALKAETIIKANMTEEQRQMELEVRQKQLSQIHELMQKQREMFGNISLEEVEQQFKLYQ